MSCILRLTGDNNLLSEIKSAGLSANVPGRVIDGSSVNVSVSKADFSDLSTQIQDAMQFLKTNEPFLKSLRVHGSLDFGIAARDVAAQTENFPPELLSLVGKLGFGLDVSIYQVSSGAEER